MHYLPTRSAQAVRGTAARSVFSFSVPVFDDQAEPKKQVASIYGAHAGVYGDSAGVYGDAAAVSGGNADTSGRGAHIDADTPFPPPLSLGNVGISGVGAVIYGKDVVIYGRDAAIYGSGGDVRGGGAEDREPSGVGEGRAWGERGGERERAQAAALPHPKAQPVSCCHPVPGTVIAHVVSGTG
eukprot:3813270-Rhodomonas_salina.3